MITYESICEKIGGDYYEILKEYNEKVYGFEGLTEDYGYTGECALDVLSIEEELFMLEYSKNKIKKEGKLY